MNLLFSQSILGQLPVRQAEGSEPVEKVARFGARRHAAYGRNVLYNRNDKPGRCDRVSHIDIAITHAILTRERAADPARFAHDNGALHRRFASESVSL